MANLYADEQFPLPVVILLRDLNHNILTVQEAGNAGLSDPEVLEFAINNERAIITQNRRDFIKLHSQNPNHAGIIVCTNDRNIERLANRINQAIAYETTLLNKLIRVNRPQ
jgi:predicted nuclease of predicted toxin-antitoxin system